MLAARVPRPGRSRAVLLGFLAAATASAIAVPAAGPAIGAPAKSHSPATHRSQAETQMGSALLSMLNQERKDHHLPALTMDSHLQLSARRHNLAMAHDNTMSHQTPGEPSLGDRETRAGYKWSWAGENIGWNSDMSQRGVLQLEQLMYNEKPPNDGHRENILSSHYRNVGVDVYVDQAHRRVWLTTDFGRH